uniref:Si:ch211-209f23.6 n=1 Tax=Cyprinus carpio carpio TaxID=630221 RepID=A0A9J8DLE4_CYPCA
MLQLSLTKDIYFTARFSAEISVFVQTGDSVQLDIQTQELPEVDFNNKTFSLTLKNMQKTDSGLYTAIASGESDKDIVTYRVSVIDAVEAPVLTVNSSGSSDS